MNIKKNRTTLLTYTALLTAATLVATAVFKIPIGLGYIHLGDAFVVLAALMLPRKYAAFSAGAGAALADIIGGFAIWAPWTAAIKIIVVLIMSLSVDVGGGSSEHPDPDTAKSEPKKSQKLPLIAAGTAAIFSAAAYYLAEGVIYGNWTVPLAGIPFNVLQLVVGAIVGQLLYLAFKRYLN